MLKEFVSAAGNLTDKFAGEHIRNRVEEIIDTTFKNPELIESINIEIRDKYQANAFYNDLSIYLDVHNTI